MTAPLNLYTKLAGISKEVGAMKKEGYRQDRRQAYFSHEQIEEAVRDQFADALIVTRWRTLESKEITGGWWARLGVTVINAEAPDERFEDEIHDTGVNLAAAHSYAVKSYYKRLLHIAEPDEEEGAKQPLPRGGFAKAVQAPAVESMRTAVAQGKNPVAALPAGPKNGPARQDDLLDDPSYLASLER